MQKTPKLSPELRKICDFMHFAFLPRLDIAKRVAAMYDGLLQDPDIEQFDWRNYGSARDLSAKILGEIIAERGVSKIKIGMTAGMDSRGLLGASLQVLPPENIIAFTNGQIGNRDYEQARFFTQNILPHHYLISTQDGKYTIEDWINRARIRPDGVTRALYGIATPVDNPLEQHGWMPKVSGFLGDACSGKRLHGKVHENWEEAVAAFVHKNEVFRPSSKRVIRSMLPDDYDPMHLMPKAPLLSGALMTYDDQLDFCYRQYQRIGTNFLPDEKTFTDASSGKANRNRHQITIYDDPRWQKSYLLMPVSERLDAKHYHAMLAANYPEIFLDLVNPDDPRFAKEDVPDDPKERLRHSARTGLHTNWEKLWLDNQNFHDLAPSPRGFPRAPGPGRVSSARIRPAATAPPGRRSDG
jgi:hypothetical protein